jgi:hypothetical protein
MSKEAWKMIAWGIGLTVLTLLVVLHLTGVLPPRHG